MKKMLSMLCCALCAAAFAAEFSVTPDRAMPVYRVGETATVTISVQENGAPLRAGVISYRISNDGLGKISSGTIDLARNNPATISVTADRPGAIQVSVKPGEIKMTNKTDRNKPSPTACGLLFDPEKIPYYGKLPADFMQFWMDGRKEIADRPLELTPISVSDPNVEAWRVKVDSVNGPVYGFLAKPKKPGKYPASVMVPGAGPGFVGPDLDFARKGYISLLMNVHEYEVPQDAKKAREIYQEQARKFYYPAKNAQDRDLYFFRRVILGVDRAINYVAAMPEYNGKNFLMYGSSQGGAMTLALTGLNKNITACAANVPAMCDHFGQDNVRPSGWPRITRQFKTPEEQSIVLQNMAYYDAANFATFITVPTFVSCGLIDGTCSPSSVYSAYNRLNTKQKDMFIMPGLGHVHTRDYIQKRDAWFEKYTR